MRPRQESLYAGLCHLCNAVPVWGLLFCGWIWYATREESRHIGLHARQAMVFHALMLTAALAYLLLEMLARIMTVLAPAVGQAIQALNLAIFGAVFIVYVGICFWGAYRSFSESDFRYPLIGRRAA